MEEANFSNQEIDELVDTILEVMTTLQVGAEIRDSWVDEMWDWCLLLLARKNGGAD